ncbi:MAG: hypothetical protein LCH76_08585 [Actinobacteria bacterium]|nr:hypothetical protein [Actinomycetota bacterium]
MIAWESRGRRRERPSAFSPAAHDDCHAVECGIDKLQHQQAFATRYDELAVRYTVTVQATVLNGWFERLS